MHTASNTLPRPGVVPPLSKPLSAIGLCVLALLVGTAPVAANDAAQAKSRLERLGDELGQVLGTLRQRLGERDSLRSRLAEADRQVAQVNTRLIETERRSAACSATSMSCVPSRRRRAHASTCSAGRWRAALPWPPAVATPIA